jgi:hypothetical protein
MATRRVFTREFKVEAVGQCRRLTPFWSNFKACSHQKTPATTSSRCEVHNRVSCWV